MRRTATLGALLALAATATPLLAQAPGADPVPDILAAWKKREQAFKTVRYVVTGKWEWFAFEGADPEWRAMIPKMPFERPYRAEVLLDIPSGRYSYHRTTWNLNVSAGGFTEFSGVTRFDGNRLMMGKAPEDTTPLPKGMNDIQIMTGYQGQPRFDSDLWPLFDAHGIVATAQQPLSPRRLKSHTAPGEFVSRGQSTIAGVTVAVLRTEPPDAAPSISDELFVDEKRDAAVLRHDYFVGKNLESRLDISWKQDESAWLPSGWTDSVTQGGKVARKGTFQVEKVDLDPPVKDDDFRLPLRAGMTVLEYDTPEPGSGLDPNKGSRKSYVVTDLGGQNVTQETGPTTLEGKQLPPQRDLGWLWWTLGGVAVVAAAITATLLVRRGRTKRS